MAKSRNLYLPALVLSSVLGQAQAMLPQSIALRPEQPEDEPFLFQVYASTRADELALTNWDEPTRRAFLDMQFAAMRRGYASMFPTGSFLIILLAGQPVGRMVLDRTAEVLRVVDLALLPSHRNAGLGTCLMQQICEEAGKAGKAVQLSVLKGSRPLRWYEHLGFRKTADAGIYDEMEWRPSSAPSGG